MHIPPLLVLFVASVLAPAIASAQNASPSKPTQLRILATGGFLGQLDGFCEHPGGTYDVPTIDKGNFLACAGADGAAKPKEPDDPVVMGGLLGVGRWIATENKDGNALVVIAGNNQVANFTYVPEEELRAIPIEKGENLSQATLPGGPQVQERFWRFWRELKGLNPDAVGLGPEDFLRSLRDPREIPATRQQPAPDRALILYRWLKLVTGTQLGLPIIGSNVVIKIKNEKVDLNVVESGDFALKGMTASESVGWLDEIEVSHSAGSNAKFKLVEVGPVGGPENRRPLGNAEPEDAKATSTTLTSTEGALKPAYEYVVEIEAGSAQSKLTFQTHRAVTPQHSTARFDGFPVIEKALGAGSTVIASMVDQSIKALLGDEVWKWTGADCPAECEIDILPPAEAMRSVVARAYPIGATRKPFVVLLSALTDANTEALIEAYPEVRAIVLPPESTMLGRASREYDKPDPKKPDESLEVRLGRRAPDRTFSGDLGFSAVFSGERPEGTTLLARPEWIGETVATMASTVSYSEKAEWLLSDEKIDVGTIPGAALRWTPCDKPESKCTRFWMEWGKDPLPYGTFNSYEVCDPKDKEQQPRCTLFASLADEDEFKVFAGDTFRRATQSELAIVPGELLDTDAYDWLTTVLNADNTRVMTRFVLERAIYRSFRIVRATVSGDALVSTIDKALKSKNYQDSCVVGTGSGCADSVNTKSPDKQFINGRLIDTRLYYAIAVPEGLADELELEHSHGTRHTADAVSALHERLDNQGKHTWLVSGDDPSLASRIVEHGEARVQHNHIASSLEFGYALNDVSQPGGNSVKITDTEIGFRSQTPSRTLVSKLDYDLAVVDFRRWAARIITTIDFNRRVDEKEVGEQIVLDSNDMTVGARLDLKLNRFARQVRFYGGYFREGELRGPRTYLTATFTEEGNGGFQRTPEASGVTVFTKDPLRYHYVAAGLDLLNHWKIRSQTKVPVEISKGTVQYAFGNLHNVPIGSTINGTPQSADTFKTGGAKAVLSEYFKANENSFDPNVVFAAIDETRYQERLQLDFNFEPSTKINNKTYKIGTELQGRWYRHVADSQDTSVQLSTRLKVSLSLPIAGRLELVPSYEREVAYLQLDESEHYSHTRFEMNLKIPFVARLGWGWLFR